MNQELQLDVAGTQQFCMMDGPMILCVLRSMETPIPFLSTQRLPISSRFPAQWVQLMERWVLLNPGHADWRADQTLSEQEA